MHILSQLVVGIFGSAGFIALILGAIMVFNAKEFPGLFAGAALMITGAILFTGMLIYDRVTDLLHKRG